jgi:dTMP kinase
VAHQEPERCHVIDANQSPDGVARDIWRLVEPLL